MQYIVKTPTQLGQVLKGYRQVNKKTQAAIAASMGLQQKAVSAIETSTGQISVDRLFQLLAALDLDLVVTKRSTRPQGDDAW